jgi:hypothetical protein
VGEGTGEAVQVVYGMQMCPRKDNLDLYYELKGSLNLPPPIIQKTHFKKSLP